MILPTAFGSSMKPPSAPYALDVLVLAPVRASARQRSATPRAGTLKWSTNPNDACEFREINPNEAPSGKHHVHETGAEVKKKKLRLNSLRSLSLKTLLGRTRDCVGLGRWLVESFISRGYARLQLIGSNMALRKSGAGITRSISTTDVWAAPDTLSAEFSHAFD